MKVLEIIAGAALNSVGVIEAFLNAGYGASPRKMEYELYKIQNRSGSAMSKAALKKEEERMKRQKFHVLLVKLQKDGLVDRDEKKRNSVFRITLKGRSYLSILKNNHREKEKAALPPAVYKNISAGKLTIIAFDIPETEKRKRAWLREALKNMGFKFIQRSVWFGKVKIPMEFMEDLKKMDIVDFVEIFEITKAGSLEKID